MEIAFKKLYKPVFTSEARYIHLWGGRSRGASHFVTDYFLFMIIQPQYFRGMFLRAILSDVRLSLWRGFKDRVNSLDDAGQIKAKDFAFNETTMSCTYLPTGNNIECKGFKKSSGTQSAKLKSVEGFTHVAIEEAEEVDYDDFSQLNETLRTDKVKHIQIFLLFNPPGKNHWIMRNYYNLSPSDFTGWYNATPKDMPELLSIKSNYLDNVANLNESTIQLFRNYGNPASPMYDADKYYRNVLGLVSEGKKGRILRRCWPITVKQFENYPYNEFYGLDFGYSTDPVALVMLKYHNGNLYGHEVIYKTGLTDDDLIREMRRNGITDQHIIADCAEPKSIATLRRAGFNITESVKGADSILNGVKFLLSLNLFVTDVSKNFWFEIEEYSWELDGNKEPTDRPEDKHNHLIDATRYASTIKCQRGEVALSLGLPDEPEQNILPEFKNQSFIPPEPQPDPPSRFMFITPQFKD
jgi:phage terminase large subunit